MAIALFTAKTTSGNCERLFNEENDRYLSPREVKQIFGYKPPTLAYWAREGKLPFITTPGGHRRYLASSLEKTLSYHKKGDLSSNKR